MDVEGSPEPIDFDFFDEDDKPSHSGGKSPSRKDTRSAAADKYGMYGQDAGGGRPDSVRSTTSSRSSLSVKIPTGSMHNRESHGERRYSSDEEDDYRHDRSKRSVNGLDKDEKKKSERSRSNSEESSPRSKSTRPKTSKGSRNSRNRHSSSSSGSSANHSNSSSLGSKSRDSSVDSTSSDSNSDSDSVTDVSPMQSPINSRSPSPPRLQYKFSDDEMDSPPEKGSRYKEQKKMTKDSVRFKEPSPSPRSGHVRPPHSKQNTKLDESEARELSMLLRAVLELEETPQRTELHDFERKLHRPTSAKRPMSGKAMPHQRMNMSFSNDEVRRIDKDNQRLLQNIMGQSPSVPNPERRRTKSARVRTRSYGSGARPASGHISHSALLRQKEQRRIEMENMKILKRIEGAKPSGELQHKTLVREFHQQQQYAAQVSKAPMRPSSARRTGKAFSTSSGSSSRGMSKASSMQSLRSDFSHASGSTATSSRSRSRPTSAKYGSGVPASKPAWDEHWAY